MRPIKMPLSLGQTGDEVANLQEILMLFISKGIFSPGSPELVNNLAAEYDKTLFGSATATLVHDYYEQKGLDDPSGPTLNQETVNSINIFLSDVMTASGITFSGYVKDKSGNTLQGAYLVHIEELVYKDSVPVTTVNVDAKGYYYYMQPASGAELTRKKGYRIEVRRQGHAEVLDSETVYVDGAEVTADLNVEEHMQQSEYTAVLASVTAVIGNNPVTAINISDAAEMQRLVNLTGEDQQLITKVVQAQQLQQAMGAPVAEELYGLLRQNVAPNLAVLLNQPETSVSGLLQVSIDNGVIQKDTDISSFATQLSSLVVTALAANSNQPAQAASGFYMADMALGDSNKAATFVSLTDGYNNGAVSNPEQKPDIWEHLQKNGFSDAEIANLKIATSIAAVTGNNPAVAGKLYSRYDGYTPIGTWLTTFSYEDLVTYIGEWSAVPGDTSYPPEVADADNKDRAYADLITKTIQQAYPTEALKVNLNTNNQMQQVFPDLQQGYDNFLSTNPGFDLRTVGAHAVSDPGSGFTMTGVANQEEFLAQLGIVQRLMNVTDNQQMIAEMAQDQLHSSRHIAAMSADVFAQKYQVKAGSIEAAKAIYTKAVSNAAYSYMAVIAQFNAATSGQIGIINHAAAVRAHADWSSLFGSADTCNCNHCQSVYSPAAYLTDLLQFLKGSAPMLYEDLAARRPDIVDIALTCANTNTPVPHIDIVNELLEDLVSKSEDGIYGMHARQTVADAQTQRAIPEYVNTKEAKFDVWDSASKKYLTGNDQVTVKSPYPVLANAYYPFRLPYNYYKRQIDTHLDLAGVRGYEIVQRMGARDAVAIWDGGNTGDMTAASNFCAEYLGITQKERDIIIEAATGATTGNIVDINNPYVFYGLHTDSRFYPLLETIPDPAQKGMLYPSQGAFSAYLPGSPADLVHTPLSGLTNWIDILAYRVDVFLQQAGITYTELLQILDCYVINPAGRVGGKDVRKMEILTNTTAKNIDTCTLSELCIQGMDIAAIKKVYRFIRLKRALGWTYYELDKAILSQSNTSDPVIDNAMFVSMAQIHRICAMLNLPVQEVALFWKDVDLRPYKDYERSEPQPIPSEYDGIFRNGLAKDIDNVQYPFKKDAINTAPADIGEFMPYLAGVLHVSTGDLTVLFNDMFNPVSSFDNSLAALSKIRKEAILMKASGYKATEWLHYRKWITTALWDTIPVLPYSNPFEMIRFLSLLKITREAGVSPKELENFLRDAYPDTIAEEKQNAGLSKMLTTLRSELQKIAIPQYFSAAAADKNGKLLEELLQRIMPKENAAQLMAIVQNPVTSSSTAGSHTAEELDFIADMAYFIDSSATTKLIDVANLSYEADLKARRGEVYRCLKNYTDGKVVRPYLTSFFAKELRLDENIVNLLLGDCIKVNNSYNAISSFYDQAFIYSNPAAVTTITRYTTVATDAAVVKTAAILQKAAWLVNSG